MRKSKSSMVIYLAIIMPVLILFFGICLDVARIKYTRSKVSAGLYSFLDIILADYNREVLGSYGIFVLAEKDYSRNFQGFIRGNLKGGNIEIRNFSFELKEPLRNKGVLKNRYLKI